MTVTDRSSPPPSPGPGLSSDPAPSPSLRQQAIAILLQREGRAWLIAALGIALGSYGSLVILPSLLGSHPRLLLGLRPTPEVMVLAGPRLGPWASFAIAFPPRLALHVSYFYLGRYYGEPLFHLLRPARSTRGRPNNPRPRAALLAATVLYQATPVDTSLGIMETRPRTFLLALVPGTVMSTAVLVAVAQGLSGTAAPAVRWVIDHELTLSLAIVTLLVGYGLLMSWWWRRRRRLRTP